MEKHIKSTLQQSSLQSSSHAGPVFTETTQPFFYSHDKEHVFSLQLSSDCNPTPQTHITDGHFPVMGLQSSPINRKAVFVDITGQLYHLHWFLSLHIPESCRSDVRVASLICWGFIFDTTLQACLKESFSSDQLKLSEKWITACESEPSACMLAFQDLPLSKEYSS